MHSIQKINQKTKILQKQKTNMKLFPWLNKLTKKINWTDIVLIKLSVAAFILWIAKIFPPILGLEPKAYLTIAILAAIKPTYSIFKK